MENITISQFEQLCADIAAKRKECDDARDFKKNLDEQLAALELKAMEYLEQLEKDSYQSNSGTIYVTHRTSVTLPKTPEDRNAFFDYLKKNGQYDALITINSNTLNAFFKKELELAKEAGNIDFKIPGISDAKVFRTIGFRKS